MVGEPLPIRAPRVTTPLPASLMNRLHEPTIGLKAANFVVFQLAWFAAVASAAQAQAVYGSFVVLAALAWHLVVAHQAQREALLMLCVTLIGVVFEVLQVRLGFIRCAGSHADALWPPAWIVFMWPLLGITLNVSLRWLRERPVVAALLGSVCGPLAFAGGVQLGAAKFVDMTAALASQALAWAALLPLLLVLARRFDGMASSRTEASHA